MSDEQAIREMEERFLRVSNRIAQALTEAGIRPSPESTAGLIALAAANAMDRRPPLRRERFLVIAGELFDIVAASVRVAGPEVRERGEEQAP